MACRKFEAIETCSMKTILSFLKPVSDGLDWVRQGLVMFWRVTKFGLSYCDKELSGLLLLCSQAFYRVSPGGGDGSIANR